MNKHFNWLHITDLHFGQKDQAPLWSNIRKAFFEDLAHLHARCGPLHAVFFTGDLAYSGEKKQFEDMERELLKPLWEKLKSLGSGEATLFCVPGNHDVKRPKETAAVKMLTKSDGFEEIASEFWGTKGNEYRSVTTSVLREYSKWWDKTPYRKIKGRDGMLVGDFAATVLVNGLKVGIVGLNTTFLQLSGGDYRKRLVMDARQLHDVCNGDSNGWVDNHDVCFLLTHQGKDWLCESADKSYSEINPAGRFVVHLFGHMHETCNIGTTEGGGKNLRLWQTSSLFGMEKFGDSQTIERQHGYSIGRVEVNEEVSTILCWPRKATSSSNGWRIVPDSERAVLQEGESMMEIISQSPLPHKRPNGASSVENGNLTNLLSSNFLDKEGPIRFSWEDLRDLIQNFHEIVTTKDSTNNSKFDYSHVNIEEKNRLNNMGKEYFESIKSHDEPYFGKILEFLENPMNEEIANSYFEIVDELRRKVAAERDKFANFESVLLHFAEASRDNIEGGLKGSKRVLNVLLSFMYVHCDLGRKV